MGSFSHSHFAHENSPDLIETRCDSCKGRVIAKRITPPLPANYRPGSGQRLEPATWDTQCTGCMRRTTRVAFDDLTEPYYQTSAAGETIWGWNRDHLCMLLRVLDGENVDADPYAYYATYCRTSWLKKREPLARAVRQLLDTTPPT